MFTPRFTSYDLRDAAQQLVQPKPRADYPKRTLRLLRTFAGVLGEKIRVRAILKENGANYISLESLIKLRKKNKLPVSSIPQKKIANNHENNHVSFN